MKAVVYTRYGPPEFLEYKDVEKPTPKEGQVLVRVRAASLNALDYRRFETISLTGRLMDEVVLRSLNKVLGADIAGQVEALGSAATRFQPGDQVFGVSAGLSGGFAEYACAEENDLVSKPESISFETAAAVPVAASTALQALRYRAKLQPGHKVLVYGASGGVGTFAVQIAKSLGAEVTAACSTRNLDIARSLGADQVIDYSREDFAGSGRRFDLILAVNGSHSIFKYRQALSPDGVCTVIGGSMSQIFQGLLLGPLVSIFTKKKIGMMGVSKVNQGDLALLRELLAAGKLLPFLDRFYPLREASKAVRYLITEHAKGKVVLKAY